MSHDVVIDGQRYIPSYRGHGEHNIVLTDYILANLRAMIEATGFRSPLTVLQTGDWIGELYALLPYIGLAPNESPINTAERAKNWLAEEHENNEFLQRIREQKLMESLSLAPERMSIVDETSWREFLSIIVVDAHRATVMFAEKWARLVEWQLSVGNDFDKCVKEMGELARDESISCLMYGEAVQVLIRFWKYGNMLQEWYRKRET